MTVKFPPGCPPAAAVPKPGTYFRLAARSLKVGDGTTDTAWRRPHETRNTPLYKKPHLPEAHGLSVFADLKDIRNAAKFSPWVQSKSVAEVTIEETDGDLLHTPSKLGKSHHDWWTNPFDLVPVGLIIAEASQAAS